MRGKELLECREAREVHKASASGGFSLVDECVVQQPERGAGSEGFQANVLCLCVCARMLELPPPHSAQGS